MGEIADDGDLVQARHNGRRHATDIQRRLRIQRIAQRVHLGPQLIRRIGGHNAQTHHVGAVPRGRLSDLRGGKVGAKPRNTPTIVRGRRRGDQGAKRVPLTSGRGEE